MTIIEAAHAFGNFVEAGKSDEFRELMWGLRTQGCDPVLMTVLAESDGDETEDGAADLGNHWLAENALHWRTGDLDRLERMLATRALEWRDTRLQLVHFIQALNGLRLGKIKPGNWEQAHIELAGLGPSREERFRQYFAAPRDIAHGFTTDDHGLRFQDGFELRFARLPILDALLTFLLSSSLRSQVRDIFTTRTTPSAAANRLGKLVDAWLDTIVRSRDEIERFRQIVAVVEQLSEGDQLRFDDHTLLRFWQKVAAEPKLYGDYVKFQTALIGFTDIARAISMATAIVQMRRREASLGTDYEAGEVEPAIWADPEKLFLGEDEVDENRQSAFAALSDDGISPLIEFQTQGRFAALKLLNKVECDRLALLLRLGRLVEPFIHSYLRGEVMGTVQSRMIQAKRDRELHRLEQLAALIELDMDSYEHVHSMLLEMQAKLQKMQTIALAVGMHWHPESFQTARAWQGLDEQPQGEVFAAILADARQNFSKTNRKGLRDALSDQAVGELVIDSIDSLNRIVSRLNAALLAINGLRCRVPLRDALAKDRPPFAATFAWLKEF